MLSTTTIIKNNNNKQLSLYIEFMMLDDSLDQDYKKISDFTFKKKVSVMLPCKG